MLGLSKCHSGQAMIKRQDRESALTIGRLGINPGPLLFGQWRIRESMACNFGYADGAGG